MASRRPDPPARPTDAELEILAVLWRQREGTVREVHAALESADPSRNRGYTTILKLLQIMVDKGLVERDESQRAHVYRAATSQHSTQGVLLDHLLDRAFGGSASQLVLRALSSQPVDADELTKIRRLLEEASACLDPPPTTSSDTSSSDDSGEPS